MHTYLLSYNISGILEKLKLPLSPKFRQLQLCDNAFIKLVTAPVIFEFVK